MNREIKFRFIYGVDGEENTYFSKVFTFGEIENGCHWEWLCDNPLYRNYSILAKHQFTGLLDKHGNEIYEEHELSNKYGVRFENGGYILYNISNGDIFQSLTQEVIDDFGFEITREYTQIS